jgi:DNA-binding NarL/FixJ family response regulator
MVLRLVAEGCTNAQIGTSLHRSEKTVRNQLTAIYRKLGAGNRAEAVAHYLMRREARTG